MEDRPFESMEGHSVLDGLDHFTGIAALIVTAMIVFFLYSWLGLHQPPNLAVLWSPPIAANLWRRVVTGEDVKRSPSTWYAAMAAYSGVILGIVSIKGILTSADRWTAGTAALWLAITVWKATRREAGR